LISEGYEDVYAIDEGFGAWMDNGYPTTGSGTNASFEIRGQSDPADAGEYAWASHEASDQQEAVPIADDGSYQMTLHFSDLTPTSPIDLRTPSYELTAPLSELTDGVVNGSLYRAPPLHRYPDSSTYSKQVPLHLGEGFSGRVLPVDRVHLAVPHAPRLHDHL